MGITKIEFGDLNLVDFLEATGWGVVEKDPFGVTYVGLNEFNGTTRIDEVVGQLGFIQVLRDEQGPFSIIKVDEFDVTVVNVCVNNSDVFDMVAEMDSEGFGSMEILNKFKRSFDVLFTVEATLADLGTSIDESWLLKDIHSEVIDQAFYNKQ